MDAARALAELTEISPQIEVAVVFDPSGEPIVGNLSDAAAARSLAGRGAELVSCADEVVATTAPDRGEPIQIEVALASGIVLLVREGDLRALAIASPDAVTGLLFFDLTICLRKVAGIQPKPRRLRALKRRGSERAGADEREEGGNGPA